MTDRPIIFSPAMVQALLAGRKSMTRRLALRPDGKPTMWLLVKPGDRLWVREAHLLYAMGGTQVCAYSCTDSSGRRGPWRPSIHMPRWASRLTLTVTATKIERLQEISEDDAQLEGCIGPVSRETAWETGLTPAQAFRRLWDSLHGAGAWEANPEVCAISFHAVKANIDSMEKPDDRAA